MGDVTAEENVYGEDAEGVRRLLYAAGDPIPEEEAKRLAGTKAKRKTADKAAAPAEDK